MLRQEPTFAPLRVKLYSFAGKKIAWKYPKQLREVMKYIQSVPKSTEVYDLKEVTIDTLSVDKSRKFQIPLYVYTPKGKDLSEEGIDVMLQFHGGGCLFGHPLSNHEFIEESMDLFAGKLAVIAPDYLKGPEECQNEVKNNAYEIFKKVLEMFNVRNIIISGTSSGGELSLHIAHLLRNDNYELFPKEKILLAPIYPGLHCGKSCPAEMRKFRNETFENYGMFVDKHTTESSRKVWEKYGCVTPSKEDDLFLLKDLANLPPHVLILAAYDKLKAQGDYYFSLLPEENENRLENQIFVIDDVHAFIQKKLAIDQDNLKVAAQIIHQQYMEFDS